MAQQPSDKNKQASKNASRPVGQGAKRTAPSKASKRSSSTLLTWGAIGLVLVIVVVLVVVVMIVVAPSRCEFIPTTWDASSAVRVALPLPFVPS